MMPGTGEAVWRGNGKSFTEILGLAEPSFYLGWVLVPVLWHGFGNTPCLQWKLHHLMLLVKPPNRIQPPFGHPDKKVLSLVGFIFGNKCKELRNCDIEPPGLSWSLQPSLGPLQKYPVKGPSSHLLSGHWRHLGLCRQPMNHSDIFHVIFLNLLGIFLLQL